MNSPDLQNNDQHISSYKESFTPDTEAGLSRLRDRIGESPGSQAKVRRLSRRSILSIAAVALLLLSAGALIFAGDGTTRVENTTNEPMAMSLPDGTEVLLQQGAEISYGADYNVTDRLIDLDGQAYFEVVKDKDRAFLVNTSKTELRVTGTAFNLRVSGEELEVEVSEGSVELHQGGEVFPVKANHCGHIVPGKPCVVMTAKELNRHAWRTGVLRFTDVPFSDVIKTVSNNYGFIVDYPEGCDFPVSSNFSNNDPVSVLQTIADLGQGELELVDASANSYKFSFSACE